MFVDLVYVIRCRSMSAGVDMLVFELGDLENIVLTVGISFLTVSSVEI